MLMSRCLPPFKSSCRGYVRLWQECERVQQAPSHDRDQATAYS